MGNTCCGVSNLETKRRIEAVIGTDGYHEWDDMPLPLTYEQMGLPNMSLESRMESAKETMDQAVDVVLSAFDDNGNGPFSEDAIRSVLDRLYISDSEEVMQALSFTDGAYTYASVKDFVGDMAKHTLQNEVLVTVLAVAKKMGIPLVNRQDPEAENAWIVDAVLWAYILHVITLTAENDRAFLKKLYTHFLALRQGKLKDWKDKVSDFEYLKTISVEPVVSGLIKSNPKRNTGKAKNQLDATLNLGLTMNMLEAMWEDYKNGNGDNAEAGYEMALLDGLFDYTRQANRARKVDSTGTMYVFSPIPRNWTDLYQSWDMDFIYQSFSDSFPTVLMKLFTPCVANYPDNPSRYLVPRVIALYCQVFRITAETVDGETGLPEMKNWTNKDFLEVWSKVNLIFAKRYRAFYEQLGQGLAGAVRKTFDVAADEFVKNTWQDFKNAVDRGEPEAVTKKLTELLQITAKLKLVKIDDSMLQRNMEFAGDRREQLDSCVKETYELYNS